MNNIITAARAQLAVKHAFFGPVILNCHVTEDSSLSTYGATDGIRNIIINPDECSAHLTVRQIIGLFLHEVLHIVFMHMLRKSHRNHKLWNVATDIVINLMILDMGYDLPPGALIKPEYKDVSAEEVYNKLQSEDSNEISMMANECIDTHLPPPYEKKEEAVQNIKDMLVSSFEAWKTSSRRGNLPGSLIKCLMDLCESKIPWQRELLKFTGTLIAKNDFSLHPPSRRGLTYGICVPSLRSYSIGQVVLSIDSSGSTFRMLQQFAAEAHVIFREVEEVTIIVSDAVVQEVIKSRNVAKFLKSMRFKGGGGTDHRPVFKYLSDAMISPEMFIGLTDGCSRYPDKKPYFPVMWALTEKHEKPPWGQTVIIR